MKVFFQLIMVLALFMLGGKTVMAANGHKLLESCRSVIKLENKQWKLFNYFDSLKAGVCLGYINGTIDMQDSMVRSNPQTKLFCLPKEVTTFKIAEVTVKYLERHNEQLFLPDYVLLHEALSASFPCKLKLSVVAQSFTE